MANTTFNPSDKAAGITLSGGNLIATNTNNATCLVRATDKQVTGKFYWEYTCNVVSGLSGVGLACPSVPTTTIIGNPAGNVVGICGLVRGGGVSADGTNLLTVGGVSGSISFGVIANGTVVGIAVDCATRQVWFRLGAAGLWNNLAGRDPATGAGGILVAGLGVGIPIHPAANVSNTNDQVTANFGDSAFTGVPPSGFTSGFTAGASVPTNAIASQALAEHWLTTNPAAQVTSVVAEQWASVASGNLQAVVTFVALEHWTSVASVVPAAGGPQITMIG